MKKRWSASLRIWHWLNAATIIVLIATALLQKLGGDIKDIFLQPHIIAGIILALLLPFRFIRALFFGDRRTFDEAKRLRNEAIKHLRERGLPRSREAFHLFHMAGVKNGYLGLYTLLTAMAVTGLSMVVLFRMGTYPELRHLLEEIHEVIFVLVALFVPVHVTGVVVAELTDEPNIVSDMINGGKE